MEHVRRPRPVGLYEKGAEDADTEMRTGLALSRLVFPCCLAVVGGGGAISKLPSSAHAFS